MTLRRALRVLGVVGLWAAMSFVGPSAEAHHIISLHACSDEPAPSGSPNPSATPTANPSASPTPSPGPQNCVPDAGSRLVGTTNLEFEVRASQSRPLERVDLFILSEEEGIPSPNERAPVLSERYKEADHVAAKTYRFAWDTVALTPYNGRYKVLVVASTYGPHPEGNGTNIQTAERRDLRVDNPPKGVAAPRIVAKSTETISVEWDAATEPDLVSYQLYRASTPKADAPPPYAAFKKVASVATPNARDDDIKGEGIYWYSVIVTRRSVVTPQTGISSQPSPISKAAEVKVAVEPDDGKKGAAAPAFQPRVISKLPRLTTGAVGLRPPQLPDAPFSAYLPYDLPEGLSQVPKEDAGVGDPRGPVLPVAVGAFLVSSALALGRMPY